MLLCVRSLRLITRSIVCVGFSRILGTLRDCARGGVLIDCIKPVTISIIETKCVFQETIGLTETTQLLRKACKVIERVQNIYDMDIVDKLVIYFRKNVRQRLVRSRNALERSFQPYDMIDSLK